jgi:uncharacterized protein YjaG (DUF416 family)
LHDEKHYNLLNTFWHLLNIDNAKFKSKELLEKLKKIEQDNFDDIHDKTKYRLLVNIN